jgi:uncharacterized protein (DUF1697 family)
VERWIALLRGINVGGRHRLPMASVRRVVADAGGAEVETYIQSGNVVFDHAARSPTRLSASLERALGETAGFAVPVVLRRGADVVALAATEPFPDTSSDTWSVAFYPDAASTRALGAIDPTTFAPERFVVAGADVHLLLPGGTGRSKLLVALVRAAPAATVRNWRTVTTLASMVSR